MRWQGMRRSGNVEDRRGMRPKMAVGGGLGVLVIVVLGALFGINPLQLLQSMPQTGGTGTQLTSNYEGDPASEEMKEFITHVLGSTEDVWSGLLGAAGQSYAPPRLVLFEQRVSSACGLASSAVGPFYCPGDDRVYLDMSFFDELERRFGAPGDFAQAYVIAHEIGHHVQNLLGISDREHAARAHQSEVEANEMSVRLELQADYFAGVWAHHAQRTTPFLDPGDLEEAIRAASAIGDDRLQKQAQGYVVPDSFTHGTSAQRVRWFRRGFESGDLRAGDTFSANDL